MSYAPTDAMASEARRGIAWRKEYGRGGTRVGAIRARQIVNKQNLSLSVVRRMHAFFSRHEADKKAEGFRRGEKGYPSKDNWRNFFHNSSNHLFYGFRRSWSFWFDNNILHGQFNTGFRYLSSGLG